MNHPVLTHVREHTWLWVGGLAVLGLLLGWLQLGTPAAVALMVAGMLIMLRGQGTDLLTIVTEDPLDSPEAANVNEAEPATARKVA